MAQRITLLLVHHYYALLLFILIGLLVALIFNIEDIELFYKNVSRKSWIALAMIMTAGLIIRLWIVPHAHHVYNDEFKHISIAENMHLFQRYAVTAQGSYERPEKTAMETWPPAYHTILALNYHLFGASENTAFNTTAVIGTLSILLIFLLANAFFNNAPIAIYSAFILAFTPVHLKYSGSTTTDINSCLLLLLALLTTVIYAKLAKTKNLLLLLAATAFAVYGRPENGIILILLPLLIILISDKSRFSTKKTLFHLAISALVLTPLLLFYFLQIVYLGIIVIKDTGWTDDWPTRFIILKNNLPLNLAFWFRERHPVCVTILAIWGLIKLSGQKNNIQPQPEKLQNDKIALFLIIWFCVFLLIYSLHYTGCFGAITTIDNDRQALNLYISVIIFAAYGIFALLNRLPAMKKYAVTAILLSCILLNSIYGFQATIRKTLNDKKHKEYTLLLRHKDEIPDNTYVIAYNVNVIISAIRKKAITPHEFLLLEPKPQKAVLFKDYWFFKKERESENLENYLKKHYDFTILGGNENNQYPSCLIMLTVQEKIPVEK